MSQILKGQCILRLYSPLRSSVRFCCSDNRKGLILGVYSGDEEKDIQLSPVAEKFNQKVQGKLLEQIQLSVRSF